MKTTGHLRKKSEPVAPKTKKTGLAKQQDMLARTFLDQIYLEKEVEKLKIELANQIDFTCMGAFKTFDTTGLCHLDLRDFTESLFAFIG